MKQKKGLKHYCVKGMRWGKRSGDSRRTHKIKKYLTRSLSNKELLVANRRMGLEKSFKNHKKKDYSSVKAVLGSVLKVIGAIKVTNVVVDNAPKAIQLLLE